MNSDSRYKWLLEMGELSFVTEPSRTDEVLERLVSEGNPFAIYCYAYRIFKENQTESFRLFEKGERLGNIRCSDALVRILWDNGEHIKAIKKYLSIIVPSNKFLSNTLIRSKLCLSSKSKEIADFDLFVNYVRKYADDDNASANYVMGHSYGSKMFWGRPEDFKIDYDLSAGYFRRAFSLGFESAEDDLKKLSEDASDFGNISYEYDDYFGDEDIGRFKFIIE